MLRNLPFCDEAGCNIPSKNKYTNAVVTNIFDDKYAAFTADVKCR